MSGAAMIGHLLLEKLVRREQPRIPESEPVMQQQDQVAAFAAGGRDQGILAYIYLFHAIMALPLIRPGDTVLDPFAGAGTTMRVAERLQRNSIGIDLNAEYIELQHRRTDGVQVEMVGL